MSHSGRYPSRLFFPAAMLHAAVFAPLSLWAMTTGGVGHLTMGSGHGSEMLSGFALAVIAGFLLPKMSYFYLSVLFTIWLLGRFAVLTNASGFWLLLPNLLFAVTITWLIVPRFTRAAKKLRNMATGPLVALIALTTTAAASLLATGLLGAAHSVLYASVTLLAGLMLFMGGRVIVPALSGACNRHGERLKIRVQPRLEGGMLLCLALATTGLVVPVLYPVAAAGAIAAGVLSWARLLRWQLWRRLESADLWGLGIGYAWVATGIACLGFTLVFGWPARVAGLHAITVGGLGTLSLNIMGRTWLFRPCVNPARVWVLVSASTLTSLAAAGRIAAIMLPASNLNWLAAGAWSLAFIVVLAGLWFPIWAQRLQQALIA